MQLGLKAVVPEHSANATNKVCERRQLASESTKVAHGKSSARTLYYCFLFLVAVIHLSHTHQNPTSTDLPQTAAARRLRRLIRPSSQTGHRQAGFIFTSLESAPHVHSMIPAPT